MAETYDVDTPPIPAKHGSAADATGDEVLGLGVDIPWDTYLGPGAAAAVADGWLSTVRHAYPATAARDLRAAGMVTGLLGGDAATHERIAAVGLRIAALRHRPARMPHRPGDEPHAWWIAEERTLVWLPWSDIDEAPYGLALLESDEADAVVVLAPEASWTLFRSGWPRRGDRGGWRDLSERLRQALAPRVGDAQAAVLWRRQDDTVTASWRAADGAVRTASITVNRRSGGIGRAHV